MASPSHPVAGGSMGGAAAAHEEHRERTEQAGAEQTGERRTGDSAARRTGVRRCAGRLIAGVGVVVGAVGAVRAGGRLVAGGAQAGRGIVPRPPRWVDAGPRLARRSAALPETRDVRTVQTAGDGAFSALGAAQPAIGRDPALLAVARAGRGRALLLADPAPLQNRLLARADNAALGLALAGPRARPVVFAESLFGYGRSTGLAALPGRWRLALALAGLAGLLWLASHARRLGPPERAAEVPPPPRREHVEALALALRRAPDAATALAPVQAAARAQVLRRAALAPDASDEVVREAARRQGFSAAEAAALTGDHDAGEALALGRALARGRR